MSKGETNIIIVMRKGAMARQIANVIARVEQIDIKEGQSVAKGAPLLKLQHLQE